MFNPGINISMTEKPMGFLYGKGCVGPKPEIRALDSIRPSLMDPRCDGPNEVYSIAMDVYKQEHKQILLDKMLLFGVVTYAKGRLGREPVRSQGHIHKVSPHCGWSTPEVYEIWQGKAVIYMQESAKDDPGRCFAVYASPGDVIVVPPYWAHATISADENEPLTFGAWCDRDYGFEYEDVRVHGGLAWFPVLERDGRLVWEANSRYQKSTLEIKGPNSYKSLGIEKGVPIYTQFEKAPDRFQFVSEPEQMAEQWANFIP